jgi:Flp pilus assembly protein TadD
MKPVRFGLATAYAVLLSTVAWGSTVTEQRLERWQSDVRAAGLSPAAVIHPFDVSPEMEQWAAEVVAASGARTAKEILDAIQAALFDDQTFDFAYADNVTLTASKAFSQRHGNCLTFTVLFVALARSVGVDATLVSVQKVPSFHRADDLVVVNRHVVAGHRTPTAWVLYDFFQTTTAPYIHQRTIPDVQASAMVHNNIGGMELRSGNQPEALRHMLLTVQLAPDWASGWVNLGVVQRRGGDQERAFASYSRALSLEPNNASALTNMAVIYRAQGRSDEARAALAAAARRTKNPFTLVALADMEIANGNYDQARVHLRRARWWFRDEPAVFEALARLERAEGRDQEARRAMSRAEELRSEVRPSE